MMDPEQYAAKLRLEELRESVRIAMGADAKPIPWPTKRKTPERGRDGVEEESETCHSRQAAKKQKKEGEEEEQEGWEVRRTSGTQGTQEKQKRQQQEQEEDIPQDDEREPEPVTDPLIYSGIYAPSGFNIMKILVEVMQRPNPKFDIGHVDSSCALVLCDLHLPDSPIVYCSEPFEVLTSYTASEILGRNCRFLQAPDGKVAQGVPRKYTDSKTAYELKTKINAKEEVQVEILNYKKGGEPFTNVLTTVPITYGSGCMRYMVGFQVDRSTQYIKNA